MDPKLFVTDPDPTVKKSFGSGSDFQKVPDPTLNMWSSPRIKILKVFKYHFETSVSYNGLYQIAPCNERLRYERCYNN
jgi:hypothetical protein